ncbi:hypothetical protein [Streptomyces sp. DSM 118878]
MLLNGEHRAVNTCGTLRRVRTSASSPRSLRYQDQDSIRSACPMWLSQRKEDFEAMHRFVGHIAFHDPFPDAARFVEVLPHGGGDVLLRPGGEPERLLDQPGAEVAVLDDGLPDSPVGERPFLLGEQLRVMDVVVKDLAPDTETQVSEVDDAGRRETPAAPSLACFCTACSRM